MQLSLISSIFSSRKSLIFLPLLFLCSIISSLPSLASPTTFDKNLKFKHITPADGLSQSSIFDIIQDKQGYIWIATQDGLNIYDGIKFKQYRSNILNENSIADNFIRKLFQDSKGNIWIGTSNGLSKYNNNLDNFENYYHNKDIQNSLLDNTIWDIYEDNNNVLWISTELGIHKFDEENNHFINIKIRNVNDGQENPFKQVKNIFQDNNGNYWFNRYEGGFSLLSNGLSSNTSLKRKIQQEIGINTKVIQQVKYLTKNKEYWLSTSNGVYVLNDDYELKMSYPLNKKSESSSFVRNIVSANDNHIWVATKEGLKSINPLEEKSNHYIFSDINHTKDNQSIYSLFIDSSNNLWVGTFNGLFVLNDSYNLIKESRFLHKELKGNINAFTSLGDEIWLSNENKLIKLNKNFQGSSNSISVTGNILHLTNNQEKIFISTEEDKLYHFDTAESSLYEYKSWSEISNHDNWMPIESINNTIWYLNLSGQLSSFDTLKNEFNTFNFLKERFTSFHIENENQVWLTTEQNKIISFNINTYIFKEFSFINSSSFIIKNTTSLNVSNEKVFLGSHSQGILTINKKSLKTILYNEDNLLANNFVTDIVLDVNGNAWVGTNKGISVIKNNNEIRSYYKDFYLNNNEYFMQSSFKDDNDKIYFGGNNGFHSFYPIDLLESTQQINEPVLSDLLIANKYVKITSSNKSNKSNNYVLPNKLNTLEQITLKHIHSPFSLEFVSPNIKLPNQVGYRYKLNGVDNNWLETDVYNRRATYTNLNPGTYKFEIQAFDIYDHANFQSKSINIQIL
ncbi:MAG: hypothetical protein KC484_05470, partial [Colwelliaceae bacterium]|nr:hypothetical protein [Colwelliaceae bacterium]